MLAGSAHRPPATIAELFPPELAARLDALDVFSRKVFAGKLQGERRSKQRGRSVEFDDYREYVAGDDPRHIDWNVFARLDRLFIKIFQEEQDLSLHLVLDASASMIAGNPTKLTFAARLATALGYIGLVNNNRVLATAFGAGPLRRLEPLRGRRHTQRLGQFMLEAIAPGAVPAVGGTAPRQSGFNDTLRVLAREHLGRGIVVVLSDLLIPEPGGYQPGLKLLAGSAAPGGIEVHVIQVLAPGELDPSVEGRREGDARNAGAFIGDLRLSDVESGRAAEVTITPAVLEQYRKSVRAYVAEAAAFCTARGMAHELATSDQDVGAVVLGALRRRGLVK